MGRALALPLSFSTLAASLGDRPACVARELTKIHEEFVRGPLSALAERYALDAPRGEVTIVVGGATESERAAPAHTEADLETEIDRRIAAGESEKDIASALAITTGKPRRQLYQLALARRRRVDPRGDSE